MANRRFILLALASLVCFLVALTVWASRGQGGAAVRHVWEYKELCPHHESTRSSVLHGRRCVCVAARITRGCFQTNTEPGSRGLGNDRHCFWRQCCGVLVQASEVTLRSLMPSARTRDPAVLSTLKSLEVTSF